MSVRAVSPVSPSAASVDTISVGHSDNMSEVEELSAGCLCYSCGNPDAAMDEDFLYLFRPREGHTITLCERSNGNVTEHRLQRVHFGNTRYLRQFLKPDLHHRPLKFDLGQLCRDHQRGYCQRGPMCRFIHICRKLPLKAPSPYQQFNSGNSAAPASHTNTPPARTFGRRSTPSPTSSQGRTSPTPFVFPTVDANVHNTIPQNAFGQESPNAQTLQLIAALQASLIANAVSNTSVPNPILGLQPSLPMPTYFNTTASPLNPAAAAYTPLFASQLAAQLGAMNASTTSQFMPQMPSMVPSMPSISVTASSSVPTSAVGLSMQGSPTTTTPSGVPLSIADIWKTPEQTRGSSPCPR